MAGGDLQARLSALTPEQRAQLKQALAARRGAAGSVISNAAAGPGPRGRGDEIPRAPDAADYPLSFAQKRLWLQEQLIEGKTAAYNVALAVTLRGALNVSALEEAFRAVLRRHAVLRTRFANGQEEPRQTIVEEFAWAIERWDEAGAERAEFLRCAEELANRPFALERELPMRVGWMPIGEGLHGVVMVFHHIACDGGSVPVLIEEVRRGYEHAIRGEPVTVEPMATRYVDYAVWHRGWIESAAGAKAKRYWTERFAELPEPIELPGDFPRPAVQDFSGHHLHVRFERAMRERLGQLGQRVGASLFMTLHATVAAFLHRYTGQEDLTIGSPTAGRIHPALEGQVGFFVNTLPLRTRIGTHDTFRAVLERVRDGVLDGFEHQGFPFDLLVEALPLERDLSRPPLFNVMMGLNRADDEAFRLPGVQTDVVPLPLASSKVDVTFHFVESDAGLELDLEYATALFTERRMRRMLAYFETFVAAVLANPDAAVGDLGLMAPRELQALIAGFNPAPRDYPRERTLVELFREQVRRDPGADAVVFDGRRFSYAEIDRLSDRIAAHIGARLGELRAEEPVALQVERSERMVAALLGILKAGGCYLPLNPGMPVERVQTMLSRSGARLRLVEDEPALAGWSGGDADLRTWSETEAPEEDDAVGTPEVPSRRLAYIMFTSGSTGEPKGTLIEQRSVVRLVRDTDFLQLGPADRVLQTGSLAFDASTFEIWGPLLNGGCCCLPKGKEILEIERFDALLQATGATTCFLTTGLFNQIADFHPEAFASLRTLLTGGEKVSVAHVNRVRAAAPGLALLHVYGPTENTTFSSWYPVYGDAGRDVPIGRAIAHSTLYIVDARGNLQPPGVAGEILCGGDGLARGYLGRADLTAERFVPDPFSGRPGARLYRTGDFGRWDEAGNIEFIGRNDDQVKIRGFRIELGEIELRLREVEAVQQAVVVARPNGGTHELIAYVVGPAGAAEESLRARLGRVLPDYMVPAHFVFLEALPLNASGKVDRRALPAPHRTEAMVVNDAVWTGASEQALAGVWQEVLGRSPEGREAHYFNSGGDSIKAIQMTARLRTRGFRLTLRDVFARPKFGELAGALVAAESGAGETVAEAGEIPLTPIQQWFLENHTPPFDHFNQATLLESAERLDAARLREALERLVARHGMLRCRVQRDAAGEWRQRIDAAAAADARVVWSEADWRGLDGGMAREAFGRAARTLHESLSLTEGRLVAAGVFRFAAADRLLLVIHHWAVDGISWRILLEELEALYGALVTGEPAPVWRNPAPFRAWAQALQAYARRPEMAREVAYWKSLDGRVPVWRGSDERVAEPAREIVFSAEETAAILSGAHVAYGTQVTELLLAAFGRAWNDVRAEAGGAPAQREAMWLALEGHGRESCVGAVDVSQTVGWFTSMWPLLLETRGDWPERIRQAKDAMRAVPERGVGYGALRYMADESVRSQLAGVGAPKISFNYLGAFGAAANSRFTGVPAGSTGEPMAAHLGAAFDLDIVGEVSGGSLRVSFHFHRAVFDASGRTGLVAAFERALRDCVAHCGRAERRRSLSDFTGGLVSLEELDRLTRAYEERGATIEDVLPLTPMQEGMVFHAVYEPASAAYSDQVNLRLEGALEPERFGRAWEALGAQYPNLRTVFRTGDTEKPLSVILEGSRLGFATIEVSDAANVREIEAVRQSEREQGFDLAEGPLLRITLVRLGPELHEAILGFHHSILDGWSSGLLWQQLEANYRALGAGARLPVVSASFRDYLRWLGARDAQRDLDAWRTLLEGCPAGAAVPTGLPRLGAPAVRTRSFTWELGRERSERLVTAARRLGTTESSLFQALWGVFLGKLTRTTDVVFGATVSGRGEQVPRVEAIVGLLINTVPVRVAWDATTSFEELAERVRRQAAYSVERVSVSLADIQAAVLERGEIVRHTLVFENYPADDAVERTWNMETIAVHDPMHFEFGVLVVPRREGWVCRVIADEARYPDAYLRALQRGWEEIVDGCLAEPAVAIEACSSGRLPVRARCVVVAATFTAEPLEDALGFWLDALGGGGDVRFAPFNQVLQQLLDGGSELRRNRGGANLILVRLEDWAGSDHTDTAAVERALEINGDAFIDGLRGLAQVASGTLQLVMFCPASGKVGRVKALADLLATTEMRLARRIEAGAGKQVRVVRAAEIAARYGAVEVDNPTGDELGAVPYTDDFYAVLATEAVRRWEAWFRPPLKVLALDADNTLWRGVVGEDGVEGLALTEGHRRLQRVAKAAKENGRLLVLVTKNNPADIDAVFRARADFPLRREDFVAIEAGWQPKSESLRAVAKRLNLGLDSFVFLDDSAMECAEVRTALPEVLTVRVPEHDAGRLERFAGHFWAGDAAADTAEDRQRSELYRVETQREEARRSSGGMGAFVRQLELELTWRAIDDGTLTRAAQLTQRTNQFNASTVRRTEAELRAWLAGDGRHGFVVDVKDRFGAYGIAGCVLYRSDAAACAWELDTFLLSCRVLGRGVEHAVLRRLAGDALRAGVETIRIPFVRTTKNAPAEQFLRGCAGGRQEEAGGRLGFVFPARALVELDVAEEAAPVDDAAEPMRSPARGEGLVQPAAWRFYEEVAGGLSTLDGLRRAIDGFRKSQRNRKLTTAYEEPRGERERQIAAIWETVLGVERVGRCDNFFALGGHSLKAVMMLSRLTRALGVAVALETIFAAPVLAEFAERVTGMGAAADGAAAAIPVTAEAEDYPLSHAQRRLWVIEQVRGAGPSPFHMGAAFRVEGALDVERLAAAFRRLIARHESLRTALVTRGDEPRQVVHAEVAFAIETMGAGGDDEFFEREFDLARPPLLRVALRRDGDARWTMAIVMHHVVSDGWSIGVMADELTALYRDVGVALPRLAMHYKDYAVWQAEALAAGRLEGARRYWLMRFADRPGGLDLPTDRRRPAMKQSHGAEVVELLAAPAWNAIKREAGRAGSSAFMALLAGLQVVLARHARAQRFVIGTPVAGRDRSELEGQIGFYVNLLPLVADVKNEGTFTEHLAAVKQTVAEALSHAAYPFDRLVDEFELPRDPSRAPLFDVLMVYQNNRDADLVLADATLQSIVRPSTTSQYDLTFDFAETETGLRLRLEYDVALFDAVRVTRLARRFFVGLENAFAAPDTTVGAIELCTADEQKEIARFERGERFGHFCASGIPALVATAGAKSPEAVAIVGDDGGLSYRELDVRSRSVAARIAGAGIARQSAIAVGGERTAEFIVVLLGVMRAGCVYLPLDLKHPDERLRMMLEDAGARHAVAIGDKAARRLRTLGVALVEGERAETLANAKMDGVAIAADELAYIIYTSGSTGRPKGVEISHGAFATMIEAQIAAFGIERADRCAWWASSAFDASLSEIFLALASGATLVVATEREREDPDRFLAWLREQRVTVATLPPAFLRVLERAPLEPLRVLVTAGEPANPGDAGHYASRLNYFNAYGPTETAVCATVQRVGVGEHTGDANIPIGRPLAVAAAYVLEASGRRAPLGVPGELCIGGRLVGRGYRGTPGLTAERFVRDPFAGNAAARMYRTGDLARWREDGALEFLGREDGQVKIRGFRIELGEIEAAIRQHPAVRDVAVLATGQAGGVALIAYLVADESVVDAVRERIAAQLPDYMRPARYLCLARLPMNASGKLDKTALPAANFSGAAESELEPPQDARERALADAWAECLGVKRVGRESDFFALGGDSIKALSLVSKIRARGWSIALKTIFAQPRLREQAAQLEAAAARAVRTVEGALDLLPIQQWFLEAHADSPRHHFNQAVFYGVVGTLDLERLQAAVRALWRRHAALRAVFACVDGAWRQTVRPASTPEPRVVVLDVHDDLPETASAREDAWVREIQAGFELGAGPLVRYGVMREATGERVLCVTHHLVSDWVSHRILLEDLNTAYARGDALPPAVTELDEWIAAARRWASEASGNREVIAAWTSVVEACRASESIGRPGRYGDVTVLAATLSVAETSRLRAALAAVPGASPRDAVLAAIVRAERECVGRSEVAVQLEGHGRDAWTGDLDVSRTVGWFTALYPFFAHEGAGTDAGWREAVARVRDGVAALPAPVAGYGILRAYGDAAAMSAAATRIGFNYLGEFVPSSDAAVFRLLHELPAGAVAEGFERDHALDVSAWIGEGRLEVQIAFREENFRRDEATRWLHQLREFLRTIVAP